MRAMRATEATPVDWFYKNRDLAGLEHIEECLRYTVEDDDLAISVVQELHAAGYVIVPRSDVQRRSDEDWQAVAEALDGELSRIGQRLDDLRFYANAKAEEGVPSFARVLDLLSGLPSPKAAT